MRILMRPAAAAVLIAAGLLCVPAANAQVQSASPGLSDQSPNIPDQKLDAAAAAIERVASLKQDYQRRIAAAAPADKERILNEAVNALAKAVTDQGLSVEEYDSILEVAQNDPEIREKNSSAHPSFGQVVARVVAADARYPCAPDTSKARIDYTGDRRCRSKSTIGAIWWNSETVPHGASGPAIYPRRCNGCRRRRSMSRTSRTKSVRTRWSIARMDRGCE